MAIEFVDGKYVRENVIAPVLEQYGFCVDMNRCSWG